jgi:hypothetical protein
MTEGHPCSWVLRNVCSACCLIEKVAPWKSLITPKECRSCANIIEEEFREYETVYSCSKGRFDGEPKPYEVRAEDYHRWFAWSGIKTANKTVAEAQFRCPLWEVRDNEHLA